MTEQLYLVSKAGRDWKNISQRQDERQQGRATARNGKSVAGAGGALIGGTYAASELFPGQLGRPGRVVDDVRSASRVYRANQKSAAKQYGKVPKELTEIDRKILRHHVNRTVRRNPAVLGVAGGATLAGIGAGMWGAGRSKARHAEAEIARLRRQRAAR